MTLKPRAGLDIQTLKFSLYLGIRLKKLANKMMSAQQKPGTPVEIWAFDKHQFGLQPLIRRIWVEIGYAP